MNRNTRNTLRAVAGIALATALGACASAAPTPPAVCEDHASAPRLDAQRLMLAEGYSMLHKDAHTIGSVRLLLMVKKDSDDFDHTVTAITDYGQKLEKDLERIGKDYPGVRIDLDPLPEMEKRKRLATGFDRFFEIAPVTGKKGPAFERTLLISLAGGLNQERHLAEVMAKEEPDASLKKFLLDTQAAMDALYDRAQALLERKYFKATGDKSG